MLSAGIVDRRLYLRVFGVYPYSALVLDPAFIFIILPERVKDDVIAYIGDLVKLISKEAEIPGNLIKDVSIYDKFSFLEVPEDYAYRVLYTMDRFSLNGRRISVQLARARI